jgi:shikimate dehydrogenase
MGPPRTNPPSSVDDTLQSPKNVSEMPATRLPIIGHPLSQTALESVVRAALVEAGSGIEIERWERRPHELAAALKEVRGDDAFAGALIASPHKEKAPPLSDWLSDDARVSGSVNVFARVEGRMRGYNSDVDGVRAGLVSILPRVKGKWPRNAVVLGAGGAARAAVAVLIGASFQHVAVLNRHLHRAEALVAHFSRTARHMELRARPWHDAIIESELGRADLLINASGIGVEEGESPIPANLMPADRYVLDLVLNRASTPLMEQASAEGGTVANGQGAFLASTSATVKLLTGSAAVPETLRAALAAELGLPEESLAVVGD